MINDQIKGSIRYILSHINSFKYARLESTTTILHEHSFFTPSKVSCISSHAISCKIVTGTNLACGAFLLRGREYTSFPTFGKSVSFLIKTSGEIEPATLLMNDLFMNFEIPEDVTGMIYSRVVSRHNGHELPNGVLQSHPPACFRFEGAIMALLVHQFQETE